jgi:putative inorganic carbon (hco3(-)) transporter
LLPARASCADALGTRPTREVLEQGRLRLVTAGNGRGPGRSTASDLLIVLGVEVLAGFVALAALGFISLKPTVLPFFCIGIAIGAFLIWRPRWIIPTFIALTWTLIPQDFFGGLPSPIETPGIAILVYAAWRAFRKRDLARDVLAVCAILALPVLAASILSPNGPSLPTDAVKNVGFLFIAALSVKAVRDVERIPTALALVAIFLSLGAVYSVLVHPTSLFPLKTPDFPFLPLENRAAGPFGEPNFFALTLASLVPLCMYLIGRGGRGQYLGGVSVLCIIAGVLATGSRGGLLAALFAIVAVGVAVPYRKLRIAAALVVVAGLAVTPVFASQTKSAGTRSVGGRITENRIAIAMFKDHPLTGVGSGQYDFLYRDYARRIGNDPRYFRQPHSLPLQIAAEQGLVGLLAWLVAGIVTMRFAIRRGVWGLPIGRAILLSIATYMIGSLFLHGAVLRLLFILIGLLFALAGALPKSRSAVPRAA